MLWVAVYGVVCGARLGQMTPLSFVAIVVEVGWYGLGILMVSGILRNLSGSCR